MTKPTSAKKSSAPQTDATLAAKLRTSKHPRKLLEAQPSGLTAVWRLLAADLLPFADPFCNLAGCCADEVPAATAISVASRLAPDAFAAPGARWALEGNYASDSAAWEAAMPTLPATAQDLLAPARARAGVALSAAARERALEAFADLAFAGSGDNHYMADTVSDLEPKPAFHARMIARLAARPDATPSTDLVTALAVAPWPTIMAMVARHGLGRLAFYHLREAMAAHDHTAAQHHELVTHGGAELEARDALEIALRAHARGEVMPPVERVLAQELIEDRGGTVEQGIALEALPPDRFAAVVALVAESGTRAYGCAGLLRDASLDEEIVDAMVGAIDRSDWSNTAEALDRPLRDLLPARAHGLALIDRAWDALAQDSAFAATPLAHQVQLLFARVKFKMTRGCATRPWQLVLPSAALVWARDCGDMIGNEEPFAGMTDAEVERLFDAYAPLDWDGTLGVANTFRDRLPARVEAMTTTALEERPWAEVAALVARTSFARLTEGERDHDVLTRLLARPEPLAARMDLVTALATREAAYSAADPTDFAAVNVLLLALQALAPHVIAARKPLPAALAEGALRMLRLDLPASYQQVLLAFPRAQVAGWIATLCADAKPAVKKRGKAYAKLVAVSGPAA